MTCRYCNHQNQADAIFCENCGKRLKGNGDNRKIYLILLAVVMILGALFSTKICIHDWKEATCDGAKTCVKCGKTEGEALGHSWTEADCTTAKTCIHCKKTVGQPLGHSWIPATCTQAKNCSACGRVEGVPASHNWVSATCISPMYCKDCNTTNGDAADHEWIPAVDLSGVEGVICVNCQEIRLPTYAWTPLTECEKISASNEDAHFADVVVGDWNAVAGKLPDALRFCVSGKESYKKTHYITYKLGGNYHYLSGLCSFMEKSDKYATAKIQVYLDDELAFASNTLSDLNPNQSFTVDIKDVKVVRIVCTTADEHTAYCALSSSVY